MIRTALRIIMGIGAACLLSAQTEEGLLAYWSFDEAEGQTAKDAGPWKMAGAVKNAVRVEGKKGSALKFNGKDAVVDMGNKEPLNVISDLTIEFWMKASAAGNDGNPYSGVITKFEPVAPNGEGYDIIVHKDGQLRACVRGPGRIDTGPRGAKVLDGAWHHIVVTATKLSVSLYIDGALSGGTATGSWESSPSKMPFLIGARSGVANFNGLLDEVRLYSRALTADEVKARYNAAK
ncbi:MAG: LamG domain-containing protein [Spirochaetota bacterium]